MGLIGPGQKDLTWIDGLKDLFIKLLLNTTRCFPYFTLVTRTRKGRHQNLINMTKDRF